MLNQFLSHPAILVSPQARWQEMGKLPLYEGESVSWPHAQLRTLLSTLCVVNSQYLALMGERLDLSNQEVRILELLKERDNLSTGEIATQVSLSSGGTTALLDRLVAMSWVHRLPDPLDRRRICVQLLPERKAELSLICQQIFSEVLSRQAQHVDAHQARFQNWFEGLRKKLASG